MTTAFVSGIGPTELLIVLGILLVLFGGRKLPQLGRDLGHGMREFKDSVTGKSKSDEEPPALASPPGGGQPETVDGEVVPERR